jgi:hypothetical protein
MQKIKNFIQSVADDEMSFGQAALLLAIALSAGLTLIWLVGKLYSSN